MSKCSDTTGKLRRVVTDTFDSETSPQLLPGSTIAVDAPALIYLLKTPFASLFDAAMMYELTSPQRLQLVTGLKNQLLAHLLPLVHDDRDLLRSMHITCLIELGNPNEAKSRVQAKRGNDDKVSRKHMTRKKKKTSFFHFR